MDLFAQLKNADKSKLKKVKTVIKTESGKTFVEEHNADKTTVIECGAQFPGFVVDLKPDFNIGRITSDLLIGMQFDAKKGYEIANYFSNLGSQDIALNLGLLKDNRVTHILNVASGVQNAFADLFIYKSVEIFDTPEFELKSRLKSCIEFIYNCHRSEGVCLVHCNAGISRSAAVVIAYLMYKQSISYEEAFDKVKLARPSINPNSGFVEQLKSLEFCFGDKNHDFLFA